MNLDALLSELSHTRPLFHSEADFQHGLAWLIHEKLPQAQVRLEVPLVGNKGRNHLDIWVRIEGRTIAIELKYFKSELTHELNGELYRLSPTVARDISRYDACKDLMRLEHLVSTGQVDTGYLVVLSSDPGFWEGGIKVDSVDAQFKIDEGKTICGLMNWSERAGKGTVEGRNDPLVLQGRYECRWRNYSSLNTAKNGIFRYLLLETDGSAITKRPLVVQDKPTKESSRAFRPLKTTLDRARAASGYKSLLEYFDCLDASEITLAIDEIAKINGGLPDSAYLHQAWWHSFESHRHAVWELAGYKAHPNLIDKKVRFTKAAQP